MSFSNPLLLQAGVGLLLLVCLGLWSQTRRRRRLAEFLGGPGAAGRLSRSDLYRRPFERVALLGGAGLALALAAADPVWDAAVPVEPPPPPPIRNLLVAIDVSASMQAVDATPTRLAAATALAEELISELDGDRVGLLLFAGRPYPLAPPTDDHQALRYLLSGVTPTIASAHDPGSLPSVAIEEATAMLQRWAAEEDQRTILLLSDGEAGESAAEIESAARAAAEAGITVHAIGIGSATGAGMSMPTAPFQLGGRIMDDDGAPAVSRLRESSLTAAAAAGAGRYALLDDATRMSRLRENLFRPSVEPSTPPGATEEAGRSRPDLVFSLTAVALFLLFLESLLDVRLPGRALSAIRRPA